MMTLLCHLQLSLCAVWNPPYSWVDFGGIIWEPVSAVSEPSRLATPCPSPFHMCTCGSSALPQPWLTHSPYEDYRLKTSFLCSVSSGSHRHVSSPCADQWLSSTAFLLCTCLHIFLPSTIPQVLGSHLLCWAAINPVLPPKTSGCIFFSGGFPWPLHTCAHTDFVCCSCSALSQRVFGFPGWDRGQEQPLRSLRVQSLPQDLHQLLVLTSSVVKWALCLYKCTGLEATTLGGKEDRFPQDFDNC